MPLWIPITVAAALFQNIRTTMQQKIRGVLSVDGANFVRYLYGAPLALSALAFLVWGTGRTVPTLTIGFLSWITVAGIAQIVATSLMIHSFSLRNYAVGTVYSKTETVFVALFATFVGHEPLHALAAFDAGALQVLGVLAGFAGEFAAGVHGGGAVDDVVGEGRADRHRAVARRRPGAARAAGLPAPLRGHRRRHIHRHPQARPARLCDGTRLARAARAGLRVRR